MASLRALRLALVWSATLCVQAERLSKPEALDASIRARATGMDEVVVDETDRGSDWESIDLADGEDDRSSEAGEGDSADRDSDSGGLAGLLHELLPHSLDFDLPTEFQSFTEEVQGLLAQLVLTRTEDTLSSNDSSVAKSTIVAMVCGKELFVKQGAEFGAGKIWNQGNERNKELQACKDGKALELLDVQGLEARQDQFRADNKSEFHCEWTAAKPAVETVARYLFFHGKYPQTAEICESAVTNYAARFPTRGVGHGVYSIDGETCHLDNISIVECLVGLDPRFVYKNQVLSRVGDLRGMDPSYDPGQR